MHRALLDSIAACGDVNRNVVAPPNPERSPVLQQVYEQAKAWSEFALPKTHAYHEIWLDEELVAGGEAEPMYGPTYLPRKFKTGFALPPSNDVDIFSQDLGFIAVVEDGKLAGYNVTAGGGQGMSHGNAETYPRQADVLGFISPDKVNVVGEAILTTQRDFGDRTNRKHARLKYTIADRGLDWFRGEVEKRSGVAFQPARPFTFTTIEDPHGWHECADGTWFYGLHILSGRIKDVPGWPMKTALRENRADPHRRFPADPVAEPEHRGRERGAKAGHRGDPGQARPRRRKQALAAPAQRPLLRRATDLRPRPGRKRARPARDPRQVRNRARRGGPGR